MTDNINKISQIKHQQTSASIANLTDEDIIKIWDSVSAYIESYMKQAKVSAIIENKTKIYQKYFQLRALTFPVLAHLVLFKNVSTSEIINIFLFNDLFLFSRKKLHKIMALNIHIIRLMVQYHYIH